MCYASGSINQAVNVCPMCKVFPHTRCPHLRDICRNRALHPRLEVSFLKNAEVESFNGCGFCKWARTNPPAKQAGYHNPGWPGCCRPPTPAEYRMIQAADWRSVSIVHHVSIPPEMKAALDSVGTRGSPIPALSASIGRGGGANTKPMIPTFDRRNSGNSSPSSKSGPVSGKTSSMTVPGKGRPGGSPQRPNSNPARNSSGNAISTSVPTTSSMEQHRSQRRQTLVDSAEKRVEGLHSSHSSPNRKHVDLEGHTPRRNASVRGSSVAPATPSISLSNIVVDSRPQYTQSAQRRGSLSSSNVTPVKSPPSPPRPLLRKTSFVVSRPAKKEGEISSASSSSGSDGLGSTTDSTITSDGGFTDYLSDESEAELQRQAEARAALVAQNQAEELEFKAARQQLAHVDLRPPKSWNPTNITNSTTMRVPTGPGAAYSPRNPAISVTQTRS